MSFQSALYTWLTEQSGITAIVSSSIYPLAIEQGTGILPAVRYEILGEDRDNTFDGQGNFVGADVQIDSVATTHAAAVALAEAIKSSLLNYSGLMGTLEVDRVYLEAVGDFYEEQLKAYRCSQSWTIWHYEA